MKLFVTAFFLLFLSNAFTQIGQPAQQWDPKRVTVNPDEKLVFVSKRYFGLGGQSMKGRFNAITFYDTLLKKDTIIYRLEATVGYTIGADNLANYAFSQYDTLKFICTDGSSIQLACISSLQTRNYVFGGDSRPSYSTFTTSFELSPEAIREILDKIIIATEFRSHSPLLCMRVSVRSKKIKKRLKTMLEAVRF